MTYYADLTPYSYFHLELEQENTFNVGWLSGIHEFPTGTVEEIFTERLWQFCGFPVQQTRGFHNCGFCGYLFRQLRVTHEGLELELGSAEIRVFGEDGKIYAAPDLIYHYVISHEYRPPDEFIAAVLNTPLADSYDYKQFLRRIGLDDSYERFLRQTGLDED